MQNAMKEVPKYSHCFACGDKNKAGLQVKFYADENGTFAQFTPRAQFEGYKGITHGGIVATLLDEIMVKAILTDEVAVTAEMTVRYKQPVRTGERLTLTAHVENHRGRFYTTVGEARRDDGVVVATATGKYLAVSPEFKAEQERYSDA